MKTNFIPALIFFSLLSTFTWAQATAPAVDTSAPPYRLGLGVIVGEPTGVNGNLFLSESTSLQAAGAWSFNDDETERTQISGDLLFWMDEVSSSVTSNYRGFAGLGYRYKMEKSGREEVHGIRIPFGFAIQYDDMPLEFFLEIVPVVDLSPETTVDWNAGIGLRILLF